MGLRLRQLTLRAVTVQGVFGANIPFEDGLCILRADNSAGKSTCIQAIIYALGLEGMLGASHSVPFPAAMTSVLRHEGNEVPVLESEVLLEVFNSQGEPLTIRRPVHGAPNTHLVSTWAAPMLTDPDSSSVQRDYYVREPGAAINPLGFHTRLAEFLGWELPTVAKFDGSESLLYLECIAPLFVVEQKHGWGGIQARLPTFYGIREMAKRAIEFLLSLDVAETILERQRLRDEASRIRSEWSATVEKCESLARFSASSIEGLPKLPIAEWPPAVAVQILVLRNDEWMHLREAIRRDKAELTRLEGQEIPLAEQVSGQITQALKNEEDSLSQRELVLRTFVSENETETAQLQSVEARLAVLDEDLRRNMDVRRLRRLGSIAQLETINGSCPTCHQSIANTLLSQSESSNPMSIDENISFIREQQRTFGWMKTSISQSLENRERKILAIQLEIRETRSRVRSLKQTLVSAGQAPSIAAIEERIRVSERIRQLELLNENLSGEIEHLGVLSKQWVSVQAGLRALPKGDLSLADEKKLDLLERSFIEQLDMYGLGSVSPTSLSISRDSYRPIRQGYDLHFELSASDNIRLIWAYVHGLLETARETFTHHPGILILDEPRQQETSRISFQQFLRRAASAREYGQQVIFATSEEEAGLRTMLSGLQYSYTGFSDKIIKPLPN